MRTLSSTTFSSKETSQRATSTFTPQPVILEEKSPWHSPMPYLFGGLAAMLGLITFALLILACSYWKLYREMGNNDDERGDVLEAAAAASNNNGGSIVKGGPADEGVFLVIMAGDFKPTCLATPVFSSVSCKKMENEGNVREDFSENIKEETSGLDLPLNSEFPRQP